MKKTIISMILVLGISSTLFTREIFSQEKPERTETVKIITEQIIENTEDIIDVKFPHFSGIDENNDKIINDLIHNDLNHLIEAKKNGMTIHDLYLLLDYEVKFLNDEIICICYEGIWIPSTNGIGFRGGHVMHTTIIDIKQEKLIQLRDLLIDAEKIYDLLEQDKFECVNPPENIKENGLFSRYDKTTQEMIKEEILSDITKEPNQRWVQWYISGNDLVFGVYKGRYINKYSIPLDEVKEYLDADIMSRIN